MNTTPIGGEFDDKFDGDNDEVDENEDRNKRGTRRRPNRNILTVQNVICCVRSACTLRWQWNCDASGIQS